MVVAIANKIVILGIVNVFINNFIATIIANVKLKIAGTGVLLKKYN